MKDLIEKDKPVIFKPLKQNMTVSEYVKMGYSRQDVEDLFVELEVEGFGKYIIGSVGRGNCSKFVGNENLPQEYFMVFKTTSIKHNYYGKPETVENTTDEVIDNIPSPEENKVEEKEEVVIKYVKQAEYDEDTDTISYKEVPKFTHAKGYRVLMSETEATIGERSAQKYKVFETVELAVKFVWEEPYFLRDMIKDQSLKFKDVVALLAAGNSVPLVLWKDRFNQKALDNQTEV